MKIIAIETDPSSVLGGKHLSFFEVCRSLSGRGHNISVLYVNPGDLLPEYQQFCSQVIRVKYHRIDKQKIISSGWNFLKSFGKVLAQIKPHRNEKPIIYIDNYYCCFLALCLSKVLGVPAIFHIRLNLGTEVIFHQQDIWSIRQMTRFITISQQTKEDWATRFNLNLEKIKVIYNGTNLELFQPSQQREVIQQKLQIEPGTKIISYVGRFDIQKGIETLLRGFALLNQQIADPVVLLLVGKPMAFRTPEEGANYQQLLQQLAIDLGIENQVRFLPYRPIAETVSIYQVSDVTVLPSLYQEPFGRVIIESMACGTPVVASRMGGIPEILTGEFASGLFQAGDHQDLADKLAYLLNWLEQDSQLGIRCREFVQSRFSLENTIDEIEDFLSQE